MCQGSSAPSCMNCASKPIEPMTDASTYRKRCHWQSLNFLQKLQGSCIQTPADANLKEMTNLEDIRDYIPESTYITYL